MMTEQEKFLFDLRGYMVVPNALSAAQLESLNALMEQNYSTADAAPNGKYFHFRHLLKWGQPYLDLVDNPRVTPYLEELCGKYFRLDHEYAVAIRHRGGGPGLHGVGGGPYDPGQFYYTQRGEIISGLTVVAYNLRDVHPGEGGFACVPGSHKANFPFPPEWCGLEEPHECVLPITGPAGTAIIFTEALWHGTLPWRSDRERRTLFFKYNQCVCQYVGEMVNPDDYPAATERQRLILSPPSGRHDYRFPKPKK